MMAEDETPDGSVPDGAETAAIPAEGAPRPVLVHASVTYTEADGRALVLMGLPRLILPIVMAIAVLLLLLVPVSLAEGKPVPWPAFGWLGLTGGLAGFFLLRMSRQVVKANRAGQSWTISHRGVNITLPGTNVTHDWSRFDEVVLRPALIQFRMGKASLVLPRRCIDESDVEAIKVLAGDVTIPVRTRGRLR